jgi:hypothetical protein
MDAVWIKVFVLTLSECVAPAGRTVCQEQAVEMQFLTQAQCEAALEQLLTLKDQSSNTIVNRQKSGCSPSARETEAFASVEAARAASDKQRWREPGAAVSNENSTVPHEERLADLSSCEETHGVAPCKMGDIIVEGAGSGRAVEVWRRDN